ncbi:MAG: sigma-70 family RNA polymerase sigma factor [Cytophagales bacterium]|nr:sigma-70 family RNA polymerase sigma factor [Cytophagales bacterium]
MNMLRKVVRKKPEWSDEQLINAIVSQKSIQEAYVFMIQEYQPMIYSLVLQNSGQISDVEELFQEGLLILLESVREGKFHHKCSLKTFLYAICRNLWLKQLGHKKRYLLKDTHDEYTLNQFGSLEPEPVQEPVMEFHRAIDQLLAKLGEPCSSILKAFYYESLKMSEILQRFRGRFSNEQSMRNKKRKCIISARSLMEKDKVVEQALRHQLELQYS